MNQIADLQNISKKSVPAHVAIIMDGNGRWAKSRGKPRIFGHKAGVEAVRQAVSFACKNGIKVLTLFAFSSENWRRPDDEVSGLMELFTWALGSEVSKLNESNVRLRIIGDRNVFSENFRRKIAEAENKTAGNDRLLLNVALNYGGRWEIVNALQKIAGKINSGELAAGDISEQLLTDNLEIPQDVDLLIRTGGEKRISNFLLWQLAYSEMFIPDVLWPEFTEEVFKEAVDYFASRERRFGCTGEQIRGE